MFLARQQLGKQVPVEMSLHAAKEEPVTKQRVGKHTTRGVLLETVFSVRPVQSGYIESIEFQSY
jgi:hypothetical protein